MVSLYTGEYARVVLKSCLLGKEIEDYRKLCSLWLFTVKMLVMRWAGGGGKKHKRKVHDSAANPLGATETFRKLVEPYSRPVAAGQRAGIYLAKSSPQTSGIGQIFS